MMNSTGKFDQFAQVNEEVDVNGKRMASYGPEVIGEVEVVYHSKRDGKVIFTKTLGHNDLLVGGATFFSEKVNNIRSSFRTQAIDEEFGIHTREYMDEIEDPEASAITTRWLANIRNEKICGITIGNGGCGDTYNQVYKVNRSARKVPGMIPFRVAKVIVDDFPETEDPYAGNAIEGINTALFTTDMRKRYFLCKVDGKYIYYYGKTWDLPPEIYVLYEDGTTVPLNADELVTDKFVRVFTKYSITIDQSDVREWFKLNDKSTLRSLINSIGLVSGWPVDDPWGYPEYCNVRQVTTFNMENHELKDSESTIEITYRLFVQ